MLVGIITVVYLVSAEAPAETGQYESSEDSADNPQLEERSSRMLKSEDISDKDSNPPSDEDDNSSSSSMFDLTAMPSLAELGKSSARIGMQLYEEERKKKEGNLLFSPFSIQTALSMVTLGSKGSSLEQLMGFVSNANSISDSMALAKQLVDMKQMFGKAMPAFHSNNNFSIELANSVFVQEETPIEAGLVSDLSKYFQSSVSFTDYKKPEKAVDLINGWIEENTKDKIKNLVSTDSINVDTKMVLANALYFKGLWSNFFEKEDTRKQDFHVTDEKTVEAEFMHLKKQLMVGSFKEQTVLGLPYAGDRFVMYLFLPHKLSEERNFFGEEEENKDDKEEEPLSVVEDMLVEDPEGLAEALNLEKFYKKKVDLLLPRFKLEETMALKENLIKLGVKAPFSADQADLSGLTGQRDLFLTDAIHKAFLEVNEEGSEGAAATALVAMSRMLPPPTPKLHFDRPFVFFIKDTLTGLVLFQGRVTDPTQ